MGEVYLAVDEQLGRRVALKLIKGLDASATARFLDEARHTAQFSHPNIVTVYGAGLIGERPYLALEYLDGATLRERIRRTGPLQVREVARLGRSVADAIAEAHAHGLVHADLKPDNLVIGRDGRVRVVDFGLSRLAGEGPSATSGTPEYMAPERWRAATPSPAIDLWALGLILCEALDGKPPLTERELAALAYAPRPVQPGPVASKAPFAGLLARCLSASPEDRPSAADLVKEFDRWLQGQPTDDARSPFRGLAAFTEADAQDFHGREADTEAVVERLRSDGLVALVGPSGVGKSSFIQAGLTPRLRDQGAWDIVTLRPGRLPIEAIARALQRAGYAGEDLRSALRSTPGALLKALRQLAQLRRSRVLLVIDQFEELLTLSDPQESAAVISALQAAPTPDEPCRLVLSFRADFLGQFAATPLEAYLGAVYVLRPLTRAALERAVVAPLKRVGYQVDSADLPARIATELDTRDSALPLLQFAMDALWRRRDTGRRVILSSEYQSMGGALGALASHAERVSFSLPETQRLQARALLLELVNVDGTRRPRSRDELLAVVGPDGAPALDLLLETRLLSSGQNEATSAPMVELAHESLTTTWPSLSRWLAETHEARAFSQELTQAAVLWASRGRRDDETWTADALRDARRRAALWKVSLTEEQQAFLQAGEHRHAQFERRVRRGRAAVVGGLSVLVVAATSAAFAFRNKELEAIAQQREIRTAAADMGRFTLSVELFDWDEERLAPVPVTAQPDPLEIAFYTARADEEYEPGPLVDSQFVVRSQPTFEESKRLEVVELRAGSTWVEVRGRGEGCGSSWVRVLSTPGYARRGELPTVALRIPSCQASRANTVEVPAGPYVHSVAADGGVTLAELPTFRIDRTEVTVAAFAPYASMSALTNDSDQSYEPSPRMPLGFIDYATSERFCRWQGKRPQSAAEWTKASRGGLWLDDAHTVANPMPTRPTVWGTTDSRGINVGRGVRDGVAEVGTHPVDRSVYGVFDLAANQVEWTRDEASSGHKLQILRGASWEFLTPQAAEARLYLIDRGLTRHRHLWVGDIGLRCASE